MCASVRACVLTPVCGSMCAAVNRWSEKKDVKENKEEKEGQINIRLNMEIKRKEEKKLNNIE